MDFPGRPGIESALTDYPVIIEDLGRGTPALAARLRTFLYQPEVLANLVASRKGSVHGLSWDKPANFIAEYICRDHALSGLHDESLETSSREVPA